MLGHQQKRPNSPDVEIEPDPKTQRTADILNKGRVTRNKKLCCTECKEVITPDFSKENDINCNKCHDFYHTECLKIVSNYIKNLIIEGKLKWICFKCQCEESQAISEMRGKMVTMEKTFQDLSDQFHSFIETISSFEQEAARLDKRIDEVEQKNNKDVENLKDLVLQLRAEIDELKSKKSAIPNNTDHCQRDVHYLKCLQRKNNLIIKGVPQQQDENESTIKETIKKIGAACSVVIQDSCMKGVHRIKKKNKKSNDDHDSILVKFDDKSDIKHTLFMGYITLIGRKQPLTCKAIGLNCDKRIYIDQHLSIELLKVQDRALLLKKAGIIDKVIARFNAIRVLVKNEWISLTSNHDMEKYFKVDYEQLKLKINNQLQEVPAEFMEH